MPELKENAFSHFFNDSFVWTNRSLSVLNIMNVVWDYYSLSICMYSYCIYLILYLLFYSHFRSFVFNSVEYQFTFLGVILEI